MTTTETDVTAFVQRLRTLHDTLPETQRTLLDTILKTAQRATTTDVTGYTTGTTLTGKAATPDVTGYTTGTATTDWDTLTTWLTTATTT